MFVNRISPLKAARFLLGVDKSKNMLDTPEVKTLTRQIQSACKFHQLDHVRKSAGSTRYKVTESAVKDWYRRTWQTQEALNGRR